MSKKRYISKSLVICESSIDGLSGIVRNELNRDPLSGEVFIFLSRSAHLIKLLHWQKDGFVLYYKRLEKGTFFPAKLEEGRSQLSYSSLLLMLEGIEIINYKKRVRYKADKSG